MSRTTATQWPVHYTAADIEAINALTAWKAENGLSNVQISDRIGTGNAIVSQIMRGKGSELVLMQENVVGDPLDAL